MISLSFKLIYRSKKKKGNLKGALEASGKARATGEIEKRSKKTASQSHSALKRSVLYCVGLSVATKEPTARVPLIRWAPPSSERAPHSFSPVFSLSTQGNNTHDPTKNNK